MKKMPQNSKDVMKTDKHQRRNLQLLICLLLAISVITVYWQVLGSEFINNYDDGSYVTRNPHIQAGLNLKGVVWAFTTGHAANWHPLTWMSHMLDISLYGLNPMGHHLTNLLIHVISTLLVFLLFTRMTGYLWRSAFVAAVFGLHPLHVESVAWVAERKDVLSTLFYFLTIWAYLRYVDCQSAGRYLITVLLFALGLMSKPMLVTLPLVLLMLDYWPLRRSQSEREKRGNSINAWKFLVLEKVPLLLLVAASNVITVIAQKGSGAVVTLDALPLAARLANALVAYWRYIGKAASPLDLAAFYPFPAQGLPLWQVIGAGVMLAFVTVVVLRSSQRCPYLTVGWLWYVVTLIPVIGLVQVGAQSMADRYTYIPLVGLSIAAAWGLPEMVALGAMKFPSVSLFKVKYLAGIAGVVITGYMALTWFQVGYWRNAVTLFEHAVNVTEDRYSYRAHYFLGNALVAKDRTDEAVGQYEEALRLRPYSAEAHNALGLALAIQGDIQTASEHFTAACKLDPREGEPHFNLATTYFVLGDYPGAWREVKLAKKLGYKPNPMFLKALRQKTGK